MVEDEFFRQLAGGELADAEPPPPPARGQRRASARRAGGAGDPVSPHPLRERPPASSMRADKSAPAPKARAGEGRSQPPQGPRGRPKGGSAFKRLVALGVLAAAVLAVASLTLGDRRAGLPQGKAGGQANAPAALGLWWRRPGRARKELNARWQRGAKAVLEGRLLDGEQRPLGGAVVSVLAADGAHPEQGKRTVGELRSDRHGRLRAAIALDRGAAHKLISLSYLARPDDSVPAATGRASVRISAPLSAAVDSRRARVGEAVGLGGRSAPGAAVEVHLSQPADARWQTLATARVDRAGRWALRARLPREAPGGRYRFRAHVRASERDGYLGATSAVSAVDVR